MISDVTTARNLLSKRKLIKGKGIYISEEEDNSQEKSKISENTDLDNGITIEIKEKVPEPEENNDVDRIKHKKKKLIKRGENIINEIIEGIKKESNSKYSKKKIKTRKTRRGKLLKRKRKRTYKRKQKEEYKGKNSLYIIKKCKKGKNNIPEEESENDNFDIDEIKEYINKKACQKKTLLKYKDIYAKKKNNRIIFLKEEDEEEYFKRLKKQYEKENEIKFDFDDNRSLNKSISIEIEKDKTQTKPFKKLRKNIDNKEMELPLDTECIICCGIIKELAFPDECDHNFCKDCLIEWSQRSGKCPMCKKNYNSINFYENGSKKQLSLNEIRKNEKKEKNINSDNDEDLGENIEKICYVCKKNTDQNNLLKCDRCQVYFCHFYCYKLDKMPTGRWYCDYCQNDIKELRENKRKLEHFFL